MLKIIIDYNNLVYNIKAMEKYIKNLGSVAKIIPMVKSNAYRIGEENVVSTLITKVNVDTFFNFSLLDAIRIRKLVDTYFPTKTITVYPVMGMLEGEENDYYNNQIIPTINNIEQYNRWNEFAKQKKQRLRCIVQFNTGMNRSGFEYYDAEKIKKIFDNSENYLDIDYVISHLCCADDLKHPMNRRQLNNIMKIKQYFNKNKFCFTASEGTLLGKEYLFDAIRPFQCLVCSIDHKNNFIGLTQVLEITADVIKIDDKNIATLDIGYQNDYKKDLLENKQLSVIINNQKYKVLDINETETKVQVDKKIKIGHTAIITNKDNCLHTITENSSIDFMEFQLAVLSNKINQKNIIYKNNDLKINNPIISKYEWNKIDEKRFCQKGENEFETIITEIRTIVNNDEYVGYSSKYKAKVGDKICVLPIGYFDIDKQFIKQNKLKFRSVNGIEFDRVGNPSMNQITISCNHKDNDKISIGDRVNIIISK